jgi:hypothetical protein
MPRLPWNQLWDRGIQYHVMKRLSFENHGTRTWPDPPIHELLPTRRPATARAGGGRLTRSGDELISAKLDHSTSCVLGQV